MKDKKKRKIISILFLIACAFLGFTIGIAEGEFALSEILVNSKAGLYEIMKNCTVVITYVASIVGIILSLVLYFKTKSMVLKAENDDNLLDKAEKMIDITSVIVTVGYTFEAITGFVAFAFYANDEEVFIPFCTIFMVFAIAVMIIVIQLLYKLNNKLNPNLEWNVMDLFIMSTAEQQSDEAQKLLLYKASYKTISICMNTLTVALIILTLLTVLFKTNALPCLTLGAVVVFIQTVFSIESYKVSHIKIKK